MLSVLGAVAASQANATNTLLTINQLADGSVAPLKALAALGHYLKLQFIPTSLFPEYPANHHWFLILLGALLNALCLNFRLFRYFKRVINLNSQVPNSAF